MAKGCDYSWDRPNLDSLRASGITFACRYLSYDHTGKNLTRQEANALQAKGIAPVSNWEWQEHSALGGYAVGQQHARDANAQHLACGGPADRPIYFSVDFDEQPGDDHSVAQYFDGINSVIGVNRTGVYGGYRVCQMLSGTGRVKWIWQTTAWSGGRRGGNTSIYQYGYGVLIGGGRVDIDQSFGTDFGQWGAATPGAGEGNRAPGIELGLTDMATPFRTMGEHAGSFANDMQTLTGRVGGLFR